MTPQAIGKLTRQDLRATTVLKEKGFLGKLPSQERGEVVRKGKR